jgi:hypothetical protein
MPGTGSIVDEPAIVERASTFTVLSMHARSQSVVTPQRGFSMAGNVNGARVVDCARPTVLASERLDARMNGNTHSSWILFRDALRLTSRLPWRSATSWTRFQKFETERHFVR